MQKSNQIRLASLPSVGDRKWAEQVEESLNFLKEKYDDLRWEMQQGH